MTVLRTLSYEETSLNPEFRVEIVALPTSTVTFVDGPRDPVTTISKLVGGYAGIYDPEYEPTADHIKKAITDINNTKLKTPLEMGTVVFLWNDVPRSFTHQAVRTRIGASFVQESMRFMGHKGVYRVLISRSIWNSEIRNDYISSIGQSILMYEKAMKCGVPIEASRAILPTDVMTSMYVGYQLSTFANVYEQRMCCQAQPGIWQLLLKECKKILAEQYGSDLETLISAPFERGEPCGYRASFDRPCSWQKAIK